jgi:DNA-binding transcriptional LysR family regulator
MLGPQENCRYRESALSMHISELENKLELRIFRHEKKRIEVTESGLVFVAECRSFLMS